MKSLKVNASGKVDVTDVVPSPEGQSAQFLQETSHASRVGLWALGIGFVVFIAWASFAPLDEGVPGQGVVAIDTKRKVVQHPSGGVIEQVFVREGDLVKDGQVLMRMDAANAKANFEQVRQRYFVLRAMEGRLVAEQTGQRKISFHPDLKAAAGDPLVRQMMLNQEQLFESRQAGLRADLQAFEESVQGQEAQIQAYEGVLINRKSQNALITEELNNTRALVKDGYVPRNRQLELERSLADVNAALADIQGNVARAKRTVAEMKQRSISRQQDFRKEVESQLASVSAEVEGEAKKFLAALGDMERIEIKAPADGQVVSLLYQSVGGVIGAGQRIMDIVPKDEPLVIEARVSPHLIDRVRQGLPVDVRFSAFAHSPQLVVAGSVMSVSGDLLQDNQATPPYYLARVAVTNEGYKELGGRQLQPGMPVEVVFKTGARSLLKYLVAPLTKRLAASMKEE